MIEHRSGRVATGAEAFAIGRTSSTGRARAENEDSMFSNEWLAIVADGMGAIKLARSPVRSLFQPSETRAHLPRLVQTTQISPIRTCLT